ncbi:MAG: hypothetical protein Q9216_004496 [Gyalolechia sp. 2 TL-2023]
MLSRGALPPALQFTSSNIVSQLLRVRIGARESCEGKFRLKDGHFDWSNLRFSIEASGRLSRKSQLAFQSFLLEITSPVAQIVHSLQRLMQYITFGKIGWLEDWPMAAARCFATTSILEAGYGYGVGPFSTTLYRGEDQSHHMQSGEGLPLKTGQWAIILVQEAFDARDQESLDEQELEMTNKFGPLGAEENKQGPAEGKERNFKALKRLRYALVKSLPESSPEPFMITDVPGYVEHVLGSEGGDRGKIDQLKEWWMKQTSDATGIGYYDDDDMQRILQNIYLDGEARNPTGSKLPPKDPVEDIMSMITNIQSLDD